MMRILLMTAALLGFGVNSSLIVDPNPAASQPAASAPGPQGDPADHFVRKMDQSPAAEKPPNWPEVMKRMSRKPPRVGEVAPDFTLKLRDGDGMVTRSKFQSDRPLVLVFGSFT